MQNRLEESVIVGVDCFAPISSHFNCKTYKNASFTRKNKIKKYFLSVYCKGLAFEYESSISMIFLTFKPLHFECVEWLVFSNVWTDKAGTIKKKRFI